MNTLNKINLIADLIEGLYDDNSDLAERFLSMEVGTMEDVLGNIQDFKDELETEEEEAAEKEHAVFVAQHKLTAQQLGLR